MWDLADGRSTLEAARRGVEGLCPKIALDLHGTECPDPKELLDRYALRDTSFTATASGLARLPPRPAHPAPIG